MTADGADDGPVHGGPHWFEPLADHMGAAYLRYSFTRGTHREVDFLFEALGLERGSRVLDVGCGPGRHAHEFARRGCRVHGIDVSARFIDIARAGAPEGCTFARADASRMRFDGEFDAVVSLCQGAFGLATGPDGDPGPRWDPDAVIFEAMARALRTGGRLAVSAFSAYFQVRHLEAGDVFDAATGVNREETSVRDESGEEMTATLWTTCFTPRELRLLAAAADLRDVEIHSVAPGDYAVRPPDLDHPEFLLLARR